MPERDALRAAHDCEYRLVAECEPTRMCDDCGGVELGVVNYGGGFWRKECLRCGSTGPFSPLPKDGPHGY